MDNIPFLHSVTVNILTIRLYRIVALARHLFAVTVLCLLCFSMVGCGSTIIVGNTSGTISDTLMGVNAGPLSTGSNGQCSGSTSHNFTAEFQSAGVTSVRTHDMRGPMDMYVLWNTATNPSMPALFNWDGSTLFSFDCPGQGPTVSVSHDSNRAFAAILAGGFEPYLRIGDSYNYANQIAVNFSDQSERNRFVTAAMTVIKHFYNNIVGSFDEFEGVDYEPLMGHYVEIWNEPDNDDFWNYDSIDYFCLYCELAQRLKNTFNMLKVGGPGGGPKALGSGFAEDFLDYVSNNCPNALDFVSFHIYDDDPDTFTTTVSAYQSIVNQYFLDSNIELHLTEYNSENTRGRPEAAVILSAAWIELQKQGKLALAHYYRGASPAILSSSAGDYCLFYEKPVSGDVVHSPTGNAFNLWNEMIQHPNMVDTTVITTGPDIRVLGGCTNNDEYAFLIVNLGTGSTDWNLSFNNLPAGVTDMTIDGINNSGDILNTMTLPISSSVSIQEGAIHLVKTIN